MEQNEKAIRNMERLLCDVNEVIREELEAVRVQTIETMVDVMTEGRDPEPTEDDIREIEGYYLNVVLTDIDKHVERIRKKLKALEGLAELEG